MFAVHFPETLAMTHTPRPTVAPLLRGVVWRLSLLGHQSVDAARFLCAGVAGGPTLLRGAAFAAMVGCAATVLPDANTDADTAAGPGDRGVVSASVVPFGAGALPADDDAEVLALIDRFGDRAAAEADRFDLDAGVLLAAAAVARDGSSTTETNPFGPLLSGPFAETAGSWRALSLSLAAAAADAPGPLATAPHRDRVIDAAASLFPDSDAAAGQLRYILDRYGL